MLTIFTLLWNNCVGSWGATAKTLLQPLNIVQRLILKASFKSKFATVALFLKTSSLTLQLLFGQSLLVQFFPALITLSIIVSL